MMHPNELDPEFEASDDNFEQEREPSPGRGKWLWIGAGAMGLLWIAAASWLILSSHQTLSEDPAQILEELHEITDITMPPGFEPRLLFKITAAYRKRPIQRWVLFVNPTIKAEIVVAELRDPFARQFEYARVRQRIEHSLEAQGVFSRSISKDRNTSTVTTVRNELSVFTLIDGRDFKTSAQRVRVEGVFPSKANAAAVFLLQAERETMPADAVVKLLESIR